MNVSISSGKGNCNETYDEQVTKKPKISSNTMVVFPKKGDYEKVKYSGLRNCDGNG
jgi:hypothetical protein